MKTKDFKLGGKTMNEIEKGYLDDLNKIKETIRESQTQTLLVVNSALIITYYKIGTLINERKEWGKKYVQRLSNDLSYLGKGYSYDNLMRMAQFSATFSKNEILEQPVPKIPWGSIIEIMKKSSSKEEMLWYVNQTYKNRWSRSTLLKQFQLDAFSRGIVEPLTSDADFQKEIIKDTLALQFASENEIHSEKDLKNKIVDNIVLFLQELGQGFALVGKEYRIVIKSGKNYYIDLLMYHTKIHAYVVIEVKLDDVEPGDFGQLNFYINAINEFEKTGVDNDTIGILLCKKADQFAVQTTLKGIINPIGVSKYKLLEELPSYLEKRLQEIE